MAAPPSSLHVGRCHCETGRQRHHVLPTTRIPYDIPSYAPGPPESVAPPAPTTGHVAAQDQPQNNPEDSDSDDVAVQDEPAGASDEWPQLSLFASGSDTYNMLFANPPMPEHGGDNAHHNSASVGDTSEDQDSGDGGDGTAPPVNTMAMAVNNNQNGNIDFFNPPANILQVLPALSLFQGGQTGALEWQVFDEDDASDFLEPSIVDSDSEAPDAASEPDEHAPPRIAIWRLNLTALSQVYNFYATAYRDQIHISRPRSCVTSRLPPSPDLVLRPGPSPQGVAVGGAVDEYFPHQVNHLIVGDLGDDEILLLAYDDGDVIAYYTRHIEEALAQASPQHGMHRLRTTPKPFFHENVGKSAWGLAIHGKSRLIAVGNNLRKVNVFAFALAGHPCSSLTTELEKEPPELFRGLYWDDARRLDMDRGFMQHLPTSAGEERRRYMAAVELSLSRRDANWQLSFDTGPAGHNIPNVTFSSTSDGEADKVVAIDIRGNVWLMDLWSLESGPYTKIESPRKRRTSFLGPGFFQDDVRPRGWGILVLPESSFLPCERSFSELLGIKQSEAKYAYSDKIGPWIDISTGVERITDNSQEHPWHRTGQHHRFILNPHDRGDRAYPRPWFDFQAGWPSMLGPTTKGLSSPKGKGSPSRRSKHDSPGRDSPQSQKQQHGGACKTKPLLADGSSIMRTYELDIELRSSEEGGVGIMFEDAIRQAKPANLFIPTMRVSHERLSSLIHIPELSLVVAASMCGRVALVTLTRPMPSRSLSEPTIPFNRGMKIERILPTKTDEDGRLRPMCPLLGVATSPMPSDDLRSYVGGGGSSSSIGLGPRPGPRRYRLMLQYYDLRILSYEIGRDSPMGSLSIV